MIISNVQFNVELKTVLERLRTELSLNNINLLEKIKDSGDDIMVTCPYHSNGQERRPSAGIRKEDGLFHCFACNETHSLAEVISHCFNKDDLGIFGWQWLLKNFSTVSIEERKDVEIDFGRSRVFSDSTLGDRTSDSNNNHFITEEELDSYRYVHPYMYKRGLTDEVIEAFDIGYDDNTKSITFPVRDIRGNCLFIARRRVDYKYFNYPAGAEKPLYGLYELFKDSSTGIKNSKTHSLGVPYSFPREVIICESMLDALSFWTVGKYAVALNGLGNELQFKQLRELPCRKLILCTDSDEAGMKARTRIRQNVRNKLITEYILPKGRKDANECTKEELMNLEEVF